MTEILEPVLSGIGKFYQGQIESSKKFIEEQVKVSSKFLETQDKVKKTTISHFMKIGAAIGTSIAFCALPVLFYAFPVHTIALMLLFPTLIVSTGAMTGSWAGYGIAKLLKAIKDSKEKMVEIELPVAKVVDPALKKV